MRRDEQKMIDVDKLLLGSIDMHIHFGPDSLFGRRQNALALARSAREVGMRAIVLKSREYMTVPLASLVAELVPEVAVFGSLTLDNDVGGLNTTVVLTAAKMGAKVVWMPTLTAANSKSKVENLHHVKLRGEGQSVLDTRGRLVPQVKEILEIVNDNNMVLGSGHLSPQEIFALAAEGKAMGFSKMVATHALQGQLMMDSALTIDQIKELAISGVFIEHSFWSCLPPILATDPKQIADCVRTIGAEHCIMTTDFGQDYNPPAPEGMRMFIATMVRNGISEQEIELMVKTNPSQLLSLG